MKEQSPQTPIDRIEGNCYFLSADFDLRFISICVAKLNATSATRIETIA